MQTPTTPEISPQQLRRARRWMLGLRVLMYGTLLTLALVLFAGRDGADVSHAAGGHMVRGQGVNGTQLELWIDAQGNPTWYRHGSVRQACDLVRPPVPRFRQLAPTVATGRRLLTAHFGEAMTGADGVRSDQRFRLTIGHAGDAWIGAITFTHSWARHGTALGRCRASDTFSIPDASKT
jgi:hypothetical protein